MILVLLFFGFYPKPITDVIGGGVAPIVAKVRDTEEFRTNPRWAGRIDLKDEAKK
jgi:NADH:ubiquinone oxidoreductase subunit 4 (subunit M)